jgi:DNA-binding IclR family transcriptional regulator
MRLASTAMPKHSPSGDPARTSKLFIGSLEKGFRLLECFESTHRRLSLTQLAQLSGLDNSSLQRLLHTLMTLGYLRKDINKLYSLTPRMLHLGTNYLRTNDLVERATPLLQIAHAKSGETINLVELDGADTIFVARFLAEHPINIWILLGSRTPVFCSAAGRVMLAHMPEDQAREIVERCDRRAFTSRTLTATDAIMAKVRQARSDGYAVSEEEFMEGDVSVGAPVFDRTGAVAAAVSCPVSALRWKSAKVRQKVVALVRENARLISNGERATP